MAKAYRDPDTDQIETGSVIQENDYDGQGRRTVQRIVNSADLDATYHYYYEGQSVVELRNGSDLVLKQHVWAGSFGAGYIDELIVTSLNSDPIADDEADVHHFALQNANFNLMGLVDEQGVLVERYEYGPYGRRQVYFSPGPNDPLAMAPTGQSRRWQVGGVEQPYGLNAIGHQGLVHDEVTGLVQNRARMLSPRLGRFVQRDSAGYVDGMSLYGYQRQMPTVLIDPSGLVSYRGGSNPPPNSYEPAINNNRATWNTWPSDPVLVDDVTFNATWLARGGRLRGLSNAAAMLQHYIGNTGDTFTADVDDLVASSYRARTRVAVLAHQAVHFIESLHTGGSYFPPIVTEEDYLTSVPRSDSEDWYLALRNFRYWGRVDDFSCSLFGRKRATLEFHIRKAYDFRLGDRQTITAGPRDIPGFGPVALQVTFDNMARMHFMGEMQAFPIEGYAACQMSWRNGPQDMRVWCGGTHVR